MAKIAVEILGSGDGWRATHVICGAGPDDRPFEEEHQQLAVAVVAAGTFQYRSRARRELLAPGALLLGNPRASYECAHEHGTGDRCIAFHFTGGTFERITHSRARFRAQKLAPSRATAPLVARVCAALARPEASWEELAVSAAACAAANDGHFLDARSPLNADARVTEAIRRIESKEPASLRQLAEDAGLSAYHFLRTFTRVAGVTPHQFALRLRLRDAAVRLATGDEKVIDVAFDSGFGDVSNFNRAFRAEFGMSPRQYRAVRPRSRTDSAPSSRRGMTGTLSSRGSSRDPLHGYEAAVSAS